MQKCHMSMQMAHTFQYLHSSNCIVLLDLGRVCSWTIRYSPQLHLWHCCTVKLMPFFLLPIFCSTWLVSVDTPWWGCHALMLMEFICFLLNPLQNRKFNSPLLSIKFRSCVCSLGECLADVGVLAYIPVLCFLKHRNICISILVKVNAKVFN